MKHYFEVTYPKRLADLKSKLEPIANKIMESFKKNPNSGHDSPEWNEEEKLLLEFSRILGVFGENTKLHLSGLDQRTFSEEYLPRVTPKYIAEQLGGNTLYFMKVIYKF